MTAISGFNSHNVFVFFSLVCHSLRLVSKRPVKSYVIYHVFLCYIAE